MQILANKTFVEIVPGENQRAVGIVTGLLTALAGSALPDPGTTIRRSRSSQRRDDMSARVCRGRKMHSTRPDLVRPSYQASPRKDLHHVKAAAQLP